MSHQTLPTALFAIISVVGLTFYGVEVCPYMDGLGTAALGPVFAGAFLLALCLRTLGLQLLIQRQRAGVIDPNWPWRTLLLNLATWSGVGLLVTGWNLLVHEMPFGSGLKAILGCLSLGIFAASYLALDCERGIVLHLARQEVSERLAPGRFLSVTTKFMVFLGSSLGFIVAIVLLVLAKDHQELQRLVEELSQEELAAIWPVKYRMVIVEICFVFAVLLSGCFLVGRRYTSNVLLVFDQQLAIFREVSQGRYDHSVPVVSHDEFSLIAEHTNGMIDGLRERDRMQSTLGKIVSPTVAESLLDEAGGLDLGGELVEVAVLFTDIRGWTPLAERLEPKELVSLLNDYFTLVVEAVHGHGGVLDKFIGDAAMAVFGLDDSPHPSDAAVRAAVQIKREMVEFNAAIRARGLPEIRTGIGIDYGEVVAGNIGSRDRLEYTVIGDSVNTAARLETLTKELSTTVALSTDVHDDCDEELRLQLRRLGHFKLKGKLDWMPVFGVDPQVWGGPALRLSLD